MREDVTHFSNGTEADVWTSHHCPGCAHYSDDQCPVLSAHWLGNHSQHGDDEKSLIIKDILALFIPRDGVFSGPCAMRTTGPTGGSHPVPDTHDRPGRPD